MNAVPISDRLTRALIGTPERTGFERQTPFDYIPEVVEERRLRRLERTRTARAFLAAEIRMARAGAHKATPNEIRSWAAWIGWPVKG